MIQPTLALDGETPHQHRRRPAKQLAWKGWSRRAENVRRRLLKGAVSIRELQADTDRYSGNPRERIRELRRHFAITTIRHHEDSAGVWHATHYVFSSVHHYATREVNPDEHD